MAKVATITQMLTPMKTVKKVGSILQVRLLFIARFETDCVTLTFGVF